MTIGEIAGAGVAKFAGAAIGMIVALLFAPPKGLAEFIRRALASTLCGFVFSGAAQSWLKLSDDIEGALAGACVAAVLSWWVLGAVRKIIGSYPKK